MSKARHPGQTGKRTWLACVAAPGLLLITLFAPAAVASETNTVDLPRFPSISPNGEEIVFSWGGDLWRAAASGGHAARLTRHQLDDLHSSWSPDGQWITFTSMRDGYMNLWRIHKDGTRLTQLTQGDRHIRHPAYGLDENGQPVITFSGLLEADVYREERSYRLSPQGGEYTRLNDAFGSMPDLSPNGRYTAFTRGGFYHGWNRRHYRGPDAMNVWLHDRQSGRFEAITSTTNDDGSAQWADNQSLVFMSDRDHHTVNLYRLNILDQERVIQPLTDFKGRDVQHFDLSRDGSTAVLHVWDTLYTLDLTNPDARPTPLSLYASNDGHDRYQLKEVGRDISEAALSPDGKTMAYIAYGRVYVRHMDEHSPTRAVTPGTHARHRNLAWSPDGLMLYFTNDLDGTESIYRAYVTLTREEIRRGQSQLLVQERPEAKPPSMSIMRTSIQYPQESQPEPLASVHGNAPEDPFAPTDPGITTDPLDPAEPSDPSQQAAPEYADEPQTGRAPEEERDAEPRQNVTSVRDPARWHDAVRFAVQSVVQTRHNDRDVSPSPDGQLIAFRRGRGDLMILDLRTGATHSLVEGWDSTLQWRWSPDSQYIAYSHNDLNFSANIFIVPADGSRKAVNITRHPRNDRNPRWSADGQKLTFISNRAGESYDIYRVYLNPDLKTYTQRDLTAYYSNARKAANTLGPLPVHAAGTPVRHKIVTADLERDLDTAWRRIERVSTSPTHQIANEMTPGGDLYVFNSAGEGLMVMHWNGNNRKRLGPAVNVQQLSTTGDRVVYLSRGRVGVASLSGGEHKHPDIADRINIDLAEQSLQKFREAARMIEESYYHTDMKGLDWPAVVEDYEALILRARTASEFSDITNRLMGELAASHMGVFNPGPASALRAPSGRLGIDHEAVELGNGRTGLRVTGVLQGGPADRGPMPVKPGDILTEIDLQPFAATDTLLGTLRGRVDVEVIATFERPVGASWKTYRKLITPVDFAELTRLRYEAFSENSRMNVRKLSNDRLGYIHIQAMNQSSLEEFQGDLYAAAEGKEGLIIDVRNNGGGNTTDRILTSIMSPVHAYTVPAGADVARTGNYPQDRLDAPRYSLPINMLVNEKSYSNAEILAHAFSTLGRGTLVGQQTYGGVISTSSYRLIDGATVRRPFRGWYTPDGTDMEHNGAMPDILVQQTPEDEITNRDRQIESAVKDLLERLDHS